MKRDLLSVSDLTPGDVSGLLREAELLKEERKGAWCGTI
jgi:hypothetical protein